MPLDLNIVIPICKIDAQCHEASSVLHEEADDNDSEVFDCQTSTPLSQTGTIRVPERS
jgi:hypothetical protein